MTINLTSQLTCRTVHGLHRIFPGQSPVTATGGSGGYVDTGGPAGALASRSRTRIHGRSEPGTYLYHSGHPRRSSRWRWACSGTIIVRPERSDEDHAYNHADSTAFDQGAPVPAQRDGPPIIHETCRSRFDGPDALEA